jgi:hypothetical protein
MSARQVKPVILVWSQSMEIFKIWVRLYLESQYEHEGMASQSGVIVR